jgi:MFS family permease
VGTLVPPRLRARYFARRTRFSQAGVLAGLLLGGLILEAASARDQRLLGFTALFTIAGLCRLLSAHLLASQSEPDPLPDHHRAVPARELVGRFRHSAAGRLLSYLLAVQISVTVASPYFSPYMLRQLELSYAGYMALVAASFAAKIAALPLLGGLARRFGAHQLLWIGGIAIVPLASFWLVSDSFFYLAGVQVVAGIAWGAYELATFLLVFETIREEERTSVLTTFNLANAVAMVAGSLIGGALLHRLGDDRDAYFTIFLLSAGARSLTLLLLFRLPRVSLEPRPLAIRTVAVRPSAGSDDRPILPSLPDPEETET